MKNLKKVLSLVLALAMAMSLMTAAFAKDYTDANKINYNEAVDVMSGIGVFDGMNGQFNPQDNLTREQAAKIITYMVLGKTNADKLVATHASYSDVKMDRWSAGAISYCTAEGIVNGHNGKFNPTAKVTGVEFAKMLLGALGYDAKIEKLVGPSWAINTSKLAVTAGLMEDLNIAMSQPLTREQAAMMAFNAEKATMVEYQGGVEINNADGSSVVVGAVRSDVVNKGAAEKNYNGVVDGTMQFCERYAKDLKLTDTTNTVDAYGRPANEWKYDGKTVSKAAAKKATFTFTAKQSEDDLNKLLKGYTFEKNLTATPNNNTGAAAATVKDLAERTGNGRLVEVYADKNDEINKVIIVDTALYQVTKVDTKKNTVTLSYKNGTDFKLTKIEEDDAGYKELSKLAKDDYVLITAAMNGSKYEIQSVAAPKVVTGKATAVNTKDNTITVDGTAYDINALSNKKADSFGISAKYDATLYLDSYGYIIDAEAGAAATSDKAVAVLKAYSGLNKDSQIVDMIQGVTSNGETVTWEVEKAVDANKGVNKVYTYVENDGVYTLTEATGNTVGDGFTYKIEKSAKIDANTKSVTMDSKPVYFDSNVKFIYVTDGKATVLDGVNKVAAESEVYATIAVKDNVLYATAMFVLAAAPTSTTTSGDVVYLAKQTGTVKALDKDGKDQTYYTYDAYINGELVKNFYAVETGKTGFFDVKINENGAYVLDSKYTTETGKMAVKTIASVESYAANIVNGEYDISNATVVDLTKAEDGVKVGAKLEMILNADNNMVDYVYVVG